MATGRRNSEDEGEEMSYSLNNTTAYRHSNKEWHAHTYSTGFCKMVVTNGSRLATQP